MDIIATLRKAVDDYFTTGTSELTDDQFDALSDEARRMGFEPPKKPEVDDRSEGWPIVAHNAWMGNIADAFVVGTDMQKWVEEQDDRSTGYASLKYDGMALELQYEKCQLAHAVLRGDYMKGEDILANARHIWGVPHEVPFVDKMSVFGEVVLSFNNLETLNERMDADRRPPYKNPRNAVALVRSIRVHQANVSLFTFRPYATWPRFSEQQPANLQTIEKWTENNHPARRFNPIKASFCAAPQAWQAKIAAHARRDGWKYLLDGVVFLTRGGESVKLKFPAESAVATVIDVTEQLGRTGVIAPVCRFEPVKLSGVTVKQATAHNHELIATKLVGLGPGARVLVSRRGDVIPHLEQVVTPSDAPWQPSGVCPSCGKKAIAEGSIMRCSSDPSECPGTSMGLVIKFCREMGIEGFGPGVVAALFSSGMVSVPGDLFSLDPELVSRAVQPGGAVLGPSTAERLCSEVQSKVATSWGELLGAVGVPGCAKEVMSLVADRFPDPDDLAKAKMDDLLQIPGIGPGRAASILWFIESRWEDVVAPLIFHMTLVTTNGPLEGKTFCITLGLRSGSRTQIEAQIRRAGGKVKSSVSSDVTHLVCNFPDENTSKLKKAKATGVPIISEDDLLAMMGAAKEDEPVNPDDDF